MADCGASGTILDRAARSLLVASNTSNGDAKHVVSNLLGHASRSSSMGPMPLHAPDEIVLFSSASQQNDALLPIPESRQRNNYMSNGNPMAQKQHHTHHQIVGPSHHVPQIHQQAFQQQQFLMQHQRQQQMMAMQQHQFVMMQQQQQQIDYMRHTQQAKQEQLQRNTLSVPEIVDEPSVVGHDGMVSGVSIDELKNAWNEAEQQQDVRSTSEVAGHDGIVQDVGMDELASAWAEANMEYQNILDQDDNNMWTGENHNKDIDELAPYDFINSTDLADTNNDMTDWMDEGMRQFNMGNLKEAIRAFEMELQQRNPDSAVAWRMLGRCHAENDMDREAIICLEHAVDRDPYCLDALLALGVSYVNELNHTKALENLKAWITHNPKFSGMEIGDDVYGNASGEDGQESSFDEVQRLLLQALELVEHNVGGDDGATTADVLEALGVVYNVSRDYDAAIHSFQKAVDIRPEDYQLWNKLGATLANSNQSSEALPAYLKALQIKPKYARAWLNMAISHSNLQNYDEAARCYLQTLSLNPRAIHCWSYLRIALSCSERWDLIPLAASQDLDAFAQHFDFMIYNT